MSKLVVGVSLFFLCLHGPAIADDSAIMHVGGTIQPMDEHPSVRLVAEHVHARIFRKHALVECVFFLKNEGPPIDVTIGFPNHGGGESSPELFDSFESYVDGQRVDVRILENGDRRPSAWYCKDVRFEAGELKAIRNVYRGRHSFDTMHDNWFTYVLHTGASWLGPIGSVNIVLTFEDFGTDQLWKIEPPGYEIDDAEIRWTLADYEPDKAMDVVEVMWDGLAPADIGSEIHRRAVQGDVEGVRRLLDEGADVDATRELSQTPLIDAIYYGAGPEMVRLLVERGATLDYDHDRELYFSALSTALLAHDRHNYPFTLDVVRILVENGAAVDGLPRRAIRRLPAQLREYLEERLQD
ncbi:MAG: hypothetical protein JW876_10840 [Candidatus Krumholzibacteriota bacterium]|nr:hypothetical protein [Candidatus Krumholzibacteriota bacterium]